MTESLAQLSSAILWKVQLVSDELIYLRILPGKVLKMILSFFLLLRIKCVKREIN